MKAYDVNGRILPYEFDEIALTNQPVVYWWKDGKKHYKIMPSIDEAIEAVDRANDKNYPAYSIATIAKGRMVMNVSFYGPLEKYGDRDRYFLGTNGAHLWWCEKQKHRTMEDNGIQELANAFHKYFAQASQERCKQEPNWAVALKERFPDIDLQVWQNGDGAYVLNGDLTFENGIYTYEVMFHDETYPNVIDGRETDKWIELRHFKIDDLKEQTFEDSLDQLDYEEQIV